MRLAHRIVLGWLLTVCAGLAVADPDDLDTWRAYAPDGGAFRVDFPSEPTTQRKERWFPVSEFVSTVYRAEVADDTFGLNHTDLPRVALFFAPKSTIFSSARDGFIEDSNASEVSFEEVEYAGHKARELVYDIPASETKPALRGRARMFFEGKRLYIVWAEVTERISPADINRYFGSFELVD